ncbi:MAG: VirD4-like conjugal transfer protein, CD1115 family, partial [Acutalibacteraceae bacterium]
KAKITDEQRNLILIGRKAYKLKQQGKNKGEIIQFLGINGDVDSAIKKWVDLKDKFAVDDTDLELCNENEKKINMFSLVQMFDKLSQKKYQNGDTDIDKYFELRPSLDRAKLKYTSIKTAPGRTKGGVFIETLHKLVVFTYGKISKMTAESSIDIKEIGFGEKPLAIFIGLPDYDKSFYFIASLFISQTYFVLSKNATFSSSGKCSRRVIFILDEFGNMPAIPNMDSVMTVCLGRNIIFNLIIQSYNQIKTKYGEAYDTIVGNCGNQVYIATADKETATLFSELIGNHTITTINRTGNKMELGKHFTEMYEEEPLINKNQLMDLKEGECVIKRVMKRTDLKGNKITPTPIFNSIKTGTQYPYRYQYMIEEFPTKSFLEVKMPSCVHIKRQKIIYDAAKGLERAEARKNGYPSFNLGVDRLISELDEDTIEQLKIIYNEHEALLSDDFETVGEMHIYDFITIAAQALEKEKLDKSVMSYIIDLVA